MKYHLRLYIFLFSFGFAQIQTNYNHPELDWQTIETEHFIIHFYDHTEMMGREAAGIAEYIYPIITGLYKYEPKAKTHLIFTDTGDVANGAAYYYDNKIVIWASPMDIALRGSHKWLDNVLTHEFTHIVSIQAAMKAGTSLPGGFLQWIGYEEETHKNVLYGYPNSVVSYPLPGVVVPPWLAEGTAQFMYSSADWDTWDSHRDMILRDRALNDNLLSFTELNIFGKSGIGNESVYNTGYAFVNYLAGRFGESVLQNIINELSRPFQVSIDKAFKKVTGINGIELYRQFRISLEEKYLISTESNRENEIFGKIIQGKGTTNLYPVWSGDGTRYAYISNKHNDYFSQTALFIADLKTGEENKIASGIHTAPTWGVGDSIIYYSRKPIRPDFQGYRYYDIYAYDIIEEKETRLTKSARAISPVFIEDSNSIAYIAMENGNQQIFQFSLDSKETKKIKSCSDGRILHSLSYDELNNRLLFDYTSHHFRNIAAISLDNYKIDDLFTEHYDERNIFLTNSGQNVFSVDKSGIFNLVLTDSSGTQYLTNVSGGAFMPNINNDGKLLYSLYRDGGYKIALIDSIEYIDKPISINANDVQNFNPPVNKPNSQSAKKYSDNIAQMFLMPRLILDYGTIKPGFYFYSSEVLSKLEVLGGASINIEKDIDFAFNLVFRKLYPTIYTEFMYATRNTVEKSKYSVYDVDDKLRFRFISLKGGLKIPILGNETIDIFTQWQRYRAFIKESIAGQTNDFGFAYDYFRGLSSGAKFNLNRIKPTVDGNINPSKGYCLKTEIAYEQNDFIDGLNLSDSGSLVENFAPNNYYKVEATGVMHFTVLPSKRWTLSLTAKGGWMSNTEVESFFNYFGGGMDGIQGYPYFSFEGTNSAFGEIALRFPIVRQAHRQIGWMILQNSTLGLEYQVGDAWTNDFSLKQSIGLQLRINGFSFYNYPTGIGFEMHRGLTSFTKEFDDIKVEYGNENRYYFTLLFGF